LRGVREAQLRGLLGHGAADFGDAVADADYGGLAAGVEVTTAILIDDPAAVAANRDGILFAKISREEGGVGRHDNKRIVAEAERNKGFANEPNWGAAVLRPYTRRKAW
jgi:hypothetical protein